MKLIILITFILISNFVIANSVDSIQSDNDVSVFLKRIDKRFLSDKDRPLQILPTATIRQKLNCDSIADKWNINNWEKIDFNSDNKTDLIVTTFWYDFDVFVAIDKGDNTYQLIQLSKDVFQNCELGKPIQLNSEQLLLFYRFKSEYNYPSKDFLDFKQISRIDTLVYKFGGFIEKQMMSASYDISEIEYHTSSGWTGISPIYKLRITRRGKATFGATSNNPKEMIPVRKVKKEVVKAISDLIQYINVKKLKDDYLVNWTDDTTVFLKITFRDGTIKEIVDYGLIGTFGLNQLYELLLMLSGKSVD